MSTRLIPEVGRWYSHGDKGQMFQVVAVDEDEGVIETQDFDGSVDEFDYDAWFAMPLRAAEAPEDSSGAVDGDDGDAFADDLDADRERRDWRSPLDELPAQPQDAAEEDEDARPAD